jgi:hypothetical protein
MHLEGMHNILQTHDLDDPYRTATPSKFRTHLLEVMGVMDLPCFAVGRQTPASVFGVGATSLQDRGRESSQ